jgi:hypothetical protein
MGIERADTAQTKQNLRIRIFIVGCGKWLLNPYGSSSVALLLKQRFLLHLPYIG